MVYKLFDLINEYLFAPILRFFMNFTGSSYAAAIFLFTLAVNIILIPLSIKSQKSSVQQLKMKPKLDELKKKYGDDKQKYNAAMQKLYQEGNVSMAGGCLPMIIRLVLMLSIFYLVTAPLTFVANIDEATLASAIESAKASGVTMTANREELALLGWADLPAEIKTAISDIKFDFFGIDLTQSPKFSFNFSNVTGAQVKLWIIPFLSFAAAIFSSIISSTQQKRNNPDAPSMKGMMLIMPFFSLFIAFSAPGALGFYWACSSFIGAFIQIFVQEFFGPHKIIAKEQATALIKRSAGESKTLSPKTDKK